MRSHTHIRLCSKPPLASHPDLKPPNPVSQTHLEHRLLCDARHNSPCRRPGRHRHLGSCLVPAAAHGTRAWSARQQSSGSEGPACTHHSSLLAPGDHTSKPHTKPRALVPHLMWLDTSWAPSCWATFCPAAETVTALPSLTTVGSSSWRAGREGEQSTEDKKRLGRESRGRRGTQLHLPSTPSLHPHTRATGHPYTVRHIRVLSP